MSKQIINSRMKGMWGKNGRGKNWLDEVEQDLRIQGIRNRHAAARDQNEWRGVLLKANVNNRF
jgi:hypothetical protein